MPTTGVSICSFDREVETITAKNSYSILKILF